MQRILMLNSVLNSFVILSKRLSFTLSKFQSFYPFPSYYFLESDQISYRTRPLTSTPGIPSTPTNQSIHTILGVMAKPGPSSTVECLTSKLTRPLNSVIHLCLTRLIRGSGEPLGGVIPENVTSFDIRCLFIFVHFPFSSNTFQMYLSE